MRKLVNFWQAYKHGFWILAYMAFYMVGFCILEHAGHRHYHVIHSVIDDLIPFCEYFVIPYILWFFYMAISVCWFIFFCKDHTEYYKLVSALAIGMTIFLIVSCVFPNMQDLRPAVFAHDNIFTRLTQMIYAKDTPTNILPSIHVYNTMVIHVALSNSPQLQRNNIVRFTSGILTVSIVLSTMFLKQHSVVDVSLAILMTVAVQMFCDRAFAQDRVVTSRKEYMSREIL